MATENVDKEEQAVRDIVEKIMKENAEVLVLDSKDELIHLQERKQSYKFKILDLRVDIEHIEALMAEEVEAREKKLKRRIGKLELEQMQGKLRERWKMIRECLDYVILLDKKIKALEKV